MWLVLFLLSTNQYWGQCKTSFSKEELQEAFFLKKPQHLPELLGVQVFHHRFSCNSVHSLCGNVALMASAGFGGQRAIPSYSSFFPFGRLSPQKVLILCSPFAQLTPKSMNGSGPCMGTQAAWELHLSCDLCTHISTGHNLTLLYICSLYEILQKAIDTYRLHNPWWLYK